MLSKSNVRVSTLDYELSHGKKPRGSGGWAFFAHGDTLDVSKAFWFYGTYTQAKNAAIAHFASRHVFDVEVGS